MKRLVGLAVAFAGMVLAIESLRVAAAWWRGEIVPDRTDWALLGCLPLLLAAWWKFLSPFGRNCGACLLPEDGGGNRDKRA